MGQLRHDLKEAGEPLIGTAMLEVRLIVGLEDIDSSRRQQHQDNE